MTRRVEVTLSVLIGIDAALCFGLFAMAVSL